MEFYDRNEDGKEDVKNRLFEVREKYEAISNHTGFEMKMVVDLSG